MVNKLTVEVLAERIEQLNELHEKNVGEIEKLKERIAGYDKMAAKWGGVLMFATALGTFIMTFLDKIQAFFSRAS